LAESLLEMFPNLTHVLSNALYVPMLCQKQLPTSNVKECIFNQIYYEIALKDGRSIVPTHLNQRPVPYCENLYKKVIL
jgi:hypothetical protein